MPDGFVDLCYIDPPFFSNKHYEVIFNDGEEIRSFKDRWKGGIEHYVDWMAERVFEIHRILKKTGSFYLHCDWHASHYLRTEIDKIFGPKQFKSNIVWCYKTREFSKRYWNRKHDDILFYTKTNEYTFNWEEEGVLEPYSKATIKKYKYKDEKGWYRLCGRGIKGSPIKSAKDVDRTWEKTHPELVVRNYLKKGYAPSDYFLMDIINQASRERMGYPTQKPEKLLDKLIKASSNKGDIVFDPFCGCGTTLVVADKLQRKWLGIDVSPTACRLMKRRLSKVTTQSIEVIGVRYDTEELKRFKPFEFQNWVIGSLGGTPSQKKVRDMGIDGYTFMERNPIQVKQGEKVGRVEIDKFETALRRVKKQKGIIIGFSFTKDAYEEVARAKRTNHLDITLMTVEEVRKKLQSSK